jgi:cell wall-associated NlpC family hydrolase
MFRRVLLVLAAVSGLAGLVTALPAAAYAAAAPDGGVRAAVQDTFTHRLTVHGWADDPARPNASITVTVRVDGRVAGRIRANNRSRHLNASHRFAGRHGFALRVRWTRRAHVVTLSTRGVDHSGARTRLGHRQVRHMQPAPGRRIVSIAKPLVGKARYRNGGASPRTGFDCSGYTKWVFAHAHLAALPHNAEAQRHARGMRRISVRHARPGDLVFYLSGGSAYHVAIYAGHHMQYAAATPRDGIRYQAVWSRDVQYRTDWH